MNKIAIIFMSFSFLSNGYLIASENSNDDNSCVYEDYCNSTRCEFFGIRFKKKSILKKLPAMSIFSCNCGPEVVTHCVDGLVKGYYRSDSCDYLMWQLLKIKEDKDANPALRFSSGKYIALYDKIKEKKEAIQSLIVSDDI